MPKKTNAQKDEIELAKSIFDEIVAETESEDWNKEKPKTKKAASKMPPKKKIEKTSATQTHQ